MVMRDDEAMVGKFASCADQAERADLASALGYNFTTQELEAEKGAFGQDDVAGILYQESRLSYDSPLGHGLDPDPKRK